MVMKKHISLIQIIVWFVAILILVFSLYQLHGDAKIINYAGIVRGGTQRLVKEEIYQQPNDVLMNKLDSILTGLQIGDKEKNIVKMTGGTFQDQLKEMSLVWGQIKEEIYEVRNGKNTDELYNISESYFDLCDLAVSEAENISNHKLTSSLYILVIYLIFSSSILIIFHRRNKTTERRMFYTDHVTGIDNHFAFQEKADLLLRRGSSYFVVCLDIDDFKYINDIYGYPMGDQILQEIARLLKRKYASAAHLDADNFLVLAEPEEQFVQHLRTYLGEGLKEKFSENMCSSITFSVGIYESTPNENAPITDILSKAEIAHKQCRNKKCATIWYDDNLINKLKKISRIEQELSRAIEQCEFEIYLQPKISLLDDNLIGAEALVRWNSSALGRLMPDEFIPHFESNGTIYLLDFYMLEHVCRLMQKEEMKNYCISINFSRITLNLDNFYELFHQIVDSFQIPYHLLEIEITEGSLQDISEFLIEVISKLRNEGIHVSIDDFGSGYSSLNMLVDMPADIIKIDKAFLCQQTMTIEHAALITSIIQIAHHLHFKVICEGVEKKEHVELLKSLSCDYAQGYFYAKPMHIDEFVSNYSSTKV